MDGHLCSFISHCAPGPFVSGFLQEKCWLQSRFREVVAVSGGGSHLRMVPSQCCCLLKSGYVGNIQVGVQKVLEVSKIAGKSP